MRLPTLAMVIVLNLFRYGTVSKFKHSEVSIYSCRKCWHVLFFFFCECRCAAGMKLSLLGYPVFTVNVER